MFTAHFQGMLLQTLLQGPGLQHTVAMTLKTSLSFDIWMKLVLLMLLFIAQPISFSRTSSSVSE